MFKFLKKKCKKRVGLGTRCGHYDKTFGKVLYCAKHFNEKLMRENPELREFVKMKKQTIKNEESLNKPWVN